MMAILCQINWREIVTPEVTGATIRIVLMVGIGFPVVLLIATLASRALRKRLSLQGAMLLRKGIIYLGTMVILISVLYQSGYKLTALLGAAGIVGIAIGFASQTSVSNVISGIFLISERSFEVGDVIIVGDTKGVVLSIDLLSVKLRTFDNQFIRIPNESLIKTQLTNITRFPIRRLDIHVGVAYKEDVDKVSKTLLDVADKNTLCLDEPAPLVRFQEFGDSALQFLLAVWCTRDDYYALKSNLRREVKERFDAEGIEIPFPHRTLYSGSVTEPFPVRVLSAELGQAQEEPPGGSQNDDAETT
jgi:small-conductance mechanosensitive channel